MFKGSQGWMCCFVARQKRQQHVLLPLVLIAVLAATAAAARIRDWDDDSGSSNWNGNSGSTWTGGSNWNSGSAWDGSQSFQSRRDPSASGAADGIPGPPNGPTMVKDNGGASVKSKHRTKSKDAGPQQGFSGGFLPKSSRCNNINLPGCQTCVGDICSACYEDLGDASFVLSPETNQCACPAGYGKVTEDALDDLWAGRRRLLESADSSSSSSSSSGSSSRTDALAINNVVQLYRNSTQQQQQQHEELVFLYRDKSQDQQAIEQQQQHLLLHLQQGEQQLVQLQQEQQLQQQQQQQQQVEAEGEEEGEVVTTMGLPMPPPAWATDCLPCPINYYSHGGAVGFAECKPCPDGWTTGNATASADCNVPYCAAGQEVNRRTSRCRACPFGSYRPPSASNLTCTTCPVGFTTPARGSTSREDCRVPICRPGEQLDMDLFTCKNCTGNTISAGGVRANGPFQPFCQECPTFTAAVNHTVCLDAACPPPDAFRIVCRQKDVPSCGPGGKPFNLNNYCTAFPVGTELQWVRATLQVTTGSQATVAFTDYGGESNNFTTPAVVECPAGANGTNVWWPFITSFRGRRNCLCNVGETSCRFARVGQVSSDSLAGPETFNRAINITIYDPQLVSLRRLLLAIGSQNNYTEFGARLGGYCRDQTDSTGRDGSNGLAISCVGPYISNITYVDGPDGYLAGGTLPPAVQLPGLSHLTDFNCSSCGLVGTFPPDWGTSNNLLALKRLDLGNNSFVGSLPESWGGLVNLEWLTLSSASDVGQIPSFWGNMRSLAYANLTQLQTDPTGCVPAEWGERNGLVFDETLFANTGSFCTT